MYTRDILTSIWYLYIFYYSYSNSCKYTFSKLWIFIRIPLATCEMKSISTFVAKKSEYNHDLVIRKVISQKK